MYSKFIFLIILVFVAEAESFHSNDPLNIIFKTQLDLSNTLTCDHSEDKIQQNTYTVLEGEEFTIVTSYEHFIHRVICHAYNNKMADFHYRSIYMKIISTFVVEKTMGNLWNCTILTDRDNTMMKPVVHYNHGDYVATYCFMKLHVRQKEPPQTMLVNQMLIPAFRKDLSEKDVDFIAEYQYEDGDVVNVTCVNLLTPTVLTMEYEMAGTTSDKYNTSNISSSKMIGFVTKLHSGHNNSYVTCESRETTDYTTVMLRFVIRTKPNIVSIDINGMILRPIFFLTFTGINRYNIEGKFAVNQPITVTCEVEQTDVQLVVTDLDESRIRNTELIPNKKTEIRFYQNAGETKSFFCGADYVVGGHAELVYIRFTTVNFPFDTYPSLHMNLPSSGTVMELYSYGDYKLTVILYEFQHDETLQLTCGPLVHSPEPAPVLYLQLNNEMCTDINCTVSTTLHHITREHVYLPIICYLKEQMPPELSNHTTIDHVWKKIRVILRERALPTEPSTITLSTDITSVIINNTAADPASETSEDSGDSSTLVYSLSAFNIMTMVILLAVLSYFCIKKKRRVRPSAPIPAPTIDPASVFYENLLSVFAPINEREAAEAAAEAAVAAEAVAVAAAAASAPEHFYEEIN